MFSTYHPCCKCFLVYSRVDEATFMDYHMLHLYVMLCKIIIFKIKGPLCCHIFQSTTNKHPVKAQDLDNKVLPSKVGKAIKRLCKKLEPLCHKTLADEALDLLRL